MVQQFIVTHTTTAHTYKGGFLSRKEAMAWISKNSATLEKYLPATCKGGSFYAAAEK